MTDSALNQFLASGTTAERTAFTPSPPTPASGADPGYLWWDTDLDQVFAWDAGSSSWKTSSAGNPVESLLVACSDETTALTTGTAKVTFRMPYAFTVTAVRASLTTAQTSGSILTVDIKESGTSILSTLITIDNTETTSTTATTPPVISDSALADDAQMTIDITQVGDGTAAGLKVALIGSRA